VCDFCVFFHRVQLQASEVFRASFDRPNICLTVQYKDVLGRPEKVYEDLARRLRVWLGDSGTAASAIVYCRRRQVEIIYLFTCRSEV
jgi:superfamily II DNA helicase RecQ